MKRILSGAVSSLAMVLTLSLLTMPVSALADDGKSHSMNSDHSQHSSKKMDMGSDHSQHSSKKMGNEAMGAKSSEMSGHEGHMAPDPKNPQISVTEKAGAVIPLDLVFKDEQGQPVSLGQLVDRPTIILPIYHSCPGACGLMMSSLSMVIKDLKSHEWGDYRAIAVSFDTDDTPEISAAAKRTYLNLLSKDYPEEHWRFLTGNQMAINHLLMSTGYKVEKVRKNLFNHPNAMIIVSGEGKIIRYMYGTRFLPFDVGMALMEAEKGRPGVSIKKILTYCFEYDPDERRYTFRFIRIFGTLIPILLFGFYFFFLRKGNKPDHRQTS